MFLIENSLEKSECYTTVPDSSVLMAKIKLPVFSEVFNKLLQIKKQINKTERREPTQRRGARCDDLHPGRELNKGSFKKEPKKHNQHIHINFHRSNQLKEER